MSRIKRLSEGRVVDFLLLLLTCFSLLPCRIIRGEETRGKPLENYLRQLGYEPVTFTYVSDHPIIEGQLDTKSCEFVIDSGCPVSLLDSGLAKDLKTPAEAGIVLKDSLLGTITNGAVVVMEKLKLGRAEFMNQPARPHNLAMDFITTRYQCILGLDFLLRNFCILDCSGCRLYVRGKKPSDDTTKAFAETLLLSGLTNVPMQWDGDLHLLIDAHINSQPVRLLVDTGGGTSVLDESEMSRLGLRTVTRMKTGSYVPADFSGLRVGLGKMGVHKLRVTKVDALQIGHTKWKGLYMGVTDLSAGIKVDGQGVKRLHGAVAPEVLAPEGAILDFINRKLWFPKEPPKRKTE